MQPTQREVGRLCRATSGFGTLFTVEERFTNQLIETDKLTADSVAQRESALLESLRLIANLENLCDRVAAGDAGRLWRHRANWRGQPTGET